MSRTYRNRPEFTPQRGIVIVQTGRRNIPVSMASSTRYRTARFTPDRHHALAPGRTFDAPVRDGDRDTATQARRDARAAGFRQHKEFRAMARQALRDTEDDSTTAGKKRRYGHRYDPAETATPKTGVRPP